MLESRAQPSGGFVIEMNADRALLLGSPLTEPGGQPLLPVQSGKWTSGSDPAPPPPSTPKFSTEWGGSFPSPFYDWLAAFVAGKSALKKIRILAVDYQGEARAQLELATAQLAQAEFPALDAASAQPARIRAVIQAPPAPWTKPASGTKVVPFAGPVAKWMCAQFHLTINGLSTAKVSKIDGIAFAAPGKCADFAISVHPMEIPAYTAWLKTKEPRQGTLGYYRANLQPMCTLTFPGLRILGIDTPPAAPTVRGTTTSALVKYIVRLSPGSVTFAAG